MMPVPTRGRCATPRVQRTGRPKPSPYRVLSGDLYRGALSGTVHTPDVDRGSCFFAGSSPATLLRTRLSAAGAVCGWRAGC